MRHRTTLALAGVVLLVALLFTQDTAQATTRTEAQQTSKAFARSKIPEVRRYTIQGVAWVRAYSGSCNPIGDRWACRPVLRYRTKAGEHGRCTWNIVVMASMVAAVADGGCVL
jgi:hypothetical protein